MRLIIVSNRLPITIDDNYNITSSIGGLAKGLNTFLEYYSLNLKQKYLWIGWPGVQLDDNHKDVKNKLEDLNCYPVNINKAQIEKFYTGFCNNTIWPVFHNLTAYFSYLEDDWQNYKEINKAFAAEVIKALKPGDILWVHDYHLLLLAQYLKKQMPDLIIGFFLHIPFPSFDTFQFLPKKCRTEILEGMLGADLIGFHTYEYAQHFIKCVTRMLGFEHTIENIITPERMVKVEVFPMGIDFEQIQSILSSIKANQNHEQLLPNINQYKTIISVDRLDYTKGISNRLVAYEEFLLNNPSWHKKVILILIVAPSRESVGHYQIMKRQIDELVGNINGRFADIDWLPICYQYKSFSTENLVSLYAASNVALVTPIMDGMNLIAKEYIAAKVSNPGVLILSESAGAAKELMNALIVNPNSKEEVAEAIKTALEMSPDEQIERMRVMQLRLKRYNVIRWGNDFIKDLIASHDKHRNFVSQFLTHNQQQEIIAKYAKAKSRALIFDYDGTLVPLVKNINMAYPSDDVLNLLNTIIQDNKNDTIIISGRDRKTLDKWLGHLDLTLIAEHGVWFKQGENWDLIRNFEAELKYQTLPVLEAFMDRLPGAFIEEKEFSLAWHYRNADPDNALRLATELFDILITLTANMELQVIHGNKVIEVRPSGVNKGVIGKFINKNNYDFIIALGDDITDEDMFTALPDDAVTIKVGNKASFAKYNLSGQDKVLEFINDLSKTASNVEAS